MGMLTSLLTKGVGVSTGFSMTRVLALVCVVLLAATTLEGHLLKRSYEAAGASQEHIEALQDTLAQQAIVDAKKKQICDAADSVTNKVSQEDNSIDNKFDGILQKVQKPERKENANANSDVLGNSLDANTVSLLNDAEAQANGSVNNPAASGSAK